MRTTIMFYGYVVADRAPRLLYRKENFSPDRFTVYAQNLQPETASAPSEAVSEISRPRILPIFRSQVCSMPAILVRLSWITEKRIACQSIERIGVAPCGYSFLGNQYLDLSRGKLNEYGRHVAAAQHSSILPESRAVPSLHLA